MLLQRLTQGGMTCVDIPQHYVDLTDPMNEIERLLRLRRIRHERNPAARWCFGNTQIAKNGNAQIKFVKEHRGKSVVRTKRIDMTAAWVNGMARARYYLASRSIYETRGIRRVGGPGKESEPGNS
jgi:phage terminase large subunit-like protein